MRTTAWPGAAPGAMMVRTGATMTADRHIPLPTLYRETDAFAGLVMPGSA